MDGAKSLSSAYLTTVPAGLITASLLAFRLSINPHLIAATIDSSEKFQAMLSGSQAWVES